MTSERETFLARWSRRKREATPAAQAEPKPARIEAGQSAATEAGERFAAPEQKAQPEGAHIDAVELPNLDDISAETDIKGFLRPGVPSDLSRAALRRAWAADPAIRDFVGLAENAQDFNAPNAIAGFGPLQATEQLTGMVNAIIGERHPMPAGHAAHPERGGAEANVIASAFGSPTNAEPHNSVSDLQSEAASEFVSAKEIASTDASAHERANFALQQGASESEGASVPQEKVPAAPGRTECDGNPHSPPRRRSGGALPV